MRPTKEIQMDSLRDHAHRKLVEFFRKQAGIDLDELGADEALFTSGIIDSLEAVNLVAYLNESLNISLDPLEISFEDLDTLNKILKSAGF